MTVLTPAETIRLMDGLAGTTHGVAVAVAATTGLRLGELLALVWNDMHGDVLSIRHAVSWPQHLEEPLIKAPKSGKERSVQLYPETIERLAEHRRAQRLAFLRGGPPSRGRDLIFPRPSGGPWRPSNFSTIYQRLVRGLDVPRHRWHDLRHTHASQLLAAGVELPEIARRLGHANPTITLRIYAHVIPGRQVEAVAKGSGLLDEARKRDQPVTRLDFSDAKTRGT